MAQWFTSGKRNNEVALFRARDIHDGVMLVTVALRVRKSFCECTLARSEQPIHEVGVGVGSVVEREIQMDLGRREDSHEETGSGPVNTNSIP